MSARQKILMCPPDHFTVDYVINPWMEGKPGEVDRDLAHQQWKRLRDAIAQEADVVEMPPVEGLPDMVFTANAGIVFEDVAIPARFFHDERRGEEEHFIRTFEEQGFRVELLPDDVRHEGAGDGLIQRGEPWLWVGHGQRSDKVAMAHIAAHVDLELIELNLIDPRYYHIDTCFCPLSGGWLLYYPNAFDEETKLRIRQRVPAERRIEVTAEEAAEFACNTVNVGDAVLMNRCSERLRGELESAGFRVTECGLSEFLKAGGSAKCLTLKLREPEV